MPEPIFINLNEENSSDVETDKNGVVNNTDLGLSNEFSNDKKISENLFSSEDIEKKYSSLHFGKNYNASEQ